MDAKEAQEIALALEELNGVGTTKYIQSIFAARDRRIEAAESRAARAEALLALALAYHDARCNCGTENVSCLGWVDRARTFLAPQQREGGPAMSKRDERIEMAARMVVAAANQGGDGGPFAHWVMVLSDALAAYTDERGDEVEPKYPTCGEPLRRIDAALEKNDGE